MTKKIKKDGCLMMACNRMIPKLEKELEKRELNKKENKDKNSEVETIETVKKDRRGGSRPNAGRKKNETISIEKTFLIPPIIYDEFVKQALILRAKLLKDAKEKLQ